MNAEFAAHQIEVQQNTQTRLTKRLTAKLRDAADSLERPVDDDQHFASRVDELRSAIDQLQHFHRQLAEANTKAVLLQEVFGQHDAA